MIKSLKIGILSIFLSIPISVSAQTTMYPISDVNVLVVRLASMAQIAVYLLVALAVVFIIWNVVIYFIRGSESDDRKKVGMQIFWGIIGLAVILSLWGLVNILLNTFWTDRYTPVDRFPNADFIGGSSSVNPYQSNYQTGGSSWRAYVPFIQQN